MTRSTALAFLLFFALLLSPARGAFADYYSYTDSRGVTNMTNKLESVPARYRSTMKVVREAPRKESAGQAAEQPPEPSAPTAQQGAAPEQEKASESRFADLSARFPWFRPLAWVAAGLALLVVLIKVTSLLPSPLLAKAVWAGFFLGVSVFLYNAYVSHLVQGTLAVKEKAVGMMKKSMEREGGAQEGSSVPAPR